MAKQGRSVQLAGSTLDHACHACAFFPDIEEEYRRCVPPERLLQELRKRDAHAA